jgi:TPR repeat protein
MRCTSRWGSGVLALAMSGQGLAGTLEDSKSAYQRGDAITAMELLMPLAEQGDVRAQMNLGTMNYTGAPPNHEEAAKWFRLAAEQGEVLAERYLGYMYANGQGVARDDKEAVKWYGRAAEHGDADAQAGLAAMYSAARGTSQNYVQAHKWFSVAASRYPASERVKRAQAIRNSERLAEKMSHSQVEEAKRLAREWQPKS